MASFYIPEPTQPQGPRVQTSDIWGLGEGAPWQNESNKGRTDKMTYRSIWIVLAAVFAFGLAACSPIQRFHGYAPDDMLLADIQVGRDTRETVAEKVGRPGLTGVMEGSAWYYVQSDWRHEGWRPPVEVRREVVTISFDASDRVSNIERFGLEQGEVVALSRRTTATGPAGMTVLAQLFANFGQFNPAQMLGGR